MESSEETKVREEKPDHDGSKRNFLKLILTLGGLATLGSFASMFRILAFVPGPNAGSTTSVPLAWPAVKIANLSSLDPTKPLTFNYPLVETPSVLLKLGQPAENGVGPDSDIVAFSDICQHLGCIYSVVPKGTSPPCNGSYKASGPVGYCCCHGSIYDLANGAKVIGGPAPRPQPQVVLSFDSSTGDIYATGMTAPTIFGHGPPGTSDPASVLQNDLTGGTIVTDATVSVVTETGT
jgi:arsenite oxidase small subunit